MSILLGNGAGTFLIQQNYGITAASYGIADGDLNGNGILDLVASNSSSNTVSVLLGAPRPSTIGQVYSIDQPAALTYVQFPTTTSIGQPIDPATGIQVAVQDAYGNTVTVNAVNGIATFNNLSVATPGTYTLTASDAPLDQNVGVSLSEFTITTTVPEPAGLSLTLLSLLTLNFRSPRSRFPATSKKTGL